MIRHLWILVLLPVLLLPLVAVTAQPGPGDGSDGEFRRAELERTDQLVERALEMLRGLDNPTAIELVGQAQQFQARAWNHFNNGEFVQARWYTQQARELLKKALNQARHNEQTEGMVLRHLERAKERLDRAAEVIAQSDNRSMVALYESARDNLTRAWEFYNSEQYRPALKLADQVEKAAEKILNSADKGQESDGTYEHRRELVLTAVQQARDAAVECSSKRGKLLLEQAEKALDTADDMAGKGSWNAAMQALQRARDFAVKSARECHGGDLLQTRYERLVSQADKIKEQSLTLSGNNREVVDRLLIQAYEQLALARGYIQSDEDEKATAALQAASLSLRQAEAYI